VIDVPVARCHARKTVLDSVPRMVYAEGRKKAAALKGDLVTDGSVPYEHGWVAYRDFGGQGPTVMLVHGLGGNLAHWGRVAPLLHEQYRLIAIDLPSHGASTAPADYSFDHDLDAVDEVRQSLGLDRPALVGHSYGGMLAVSLGASRPGDYRAVVNIDGLGFALDTEREPESRTEELPEGASVNEGDAEWLEAEVSREVEEAASIGLRLDRDDEMVRRAFQLGGDGRWHSSPTIDRFVEIGHALEALDLMPAYTATSCRTVTVLAEHHYAPNEEAAASARRHAEQVRAALVGAGAEVDSVPSGHYPHVEVPEVTAGRFGEWVGS
jgi:pimeloyl-ACP methyl ester carboxylesterase